MKIKNIFKQLLCFIFIIFALIGENSYSSKLYANANDNSNNEITYSIFINAPTYSFVYDDKVYFIDSYDSKLKIYNSNTNAFISEFVDLKNYGNIIDAVFCENYIFAITKIENNHYLLKINLIIDSLSISFIEYNDPSIINGQISSNYSKLYVSFINEKFYIVLTPSININSSLILIYNDQDNYVEHQTNIIFDDDFNVSIINSLEKILICKSNEFINLIFICKSGIYATNLPILDIDEKNDITITDTSFSRNLDTSYFDTETYSEILILNINFCTINDKNYLLITYKQTKLDGTVSSYTKIYEINISLYGNASIFETISEFTSPLTNYLCVSNKSITYPSNQTINYLEIDFNNDNVLVESKYSISNPNLKVNFYDVNDFIYVKTNISTMLLSSPWNALEIISIPVDTDLIIIGNGFIENQNLELEDYKYCLYTFENKNYFGYVKVQDLNIKEEIPVENSDYENCSVISKTAIYSMPTKVLGDKITDTLTSSIIGTITDNSKIEVIDLLCNYKSNNSIFIKVKVDENIIGYIESNQIKNQNNINYYITNNATIKTNNTSLFLEAKEDSKVLYTFKNGDRVRIIDSKDKRSGFTKIEFCDEYGKKYTGYVLSDNISSDGWTIMQIVGSILIAINIIILILIIYFVKNRVNNSEPKVNNNNDDEFDYKN